MRVWRSGSKWWRISASVKNCLNRVNASLASGVRKGVASRAVLGDVAFTDFKVLSFAEFFDFLPFTSLTSPILIPSPSTSLPASSLVFPVASILTFLVVSLGPLRLAAVSFGIEVRGAAILLKPLMNRIEIGKSQKHLNILYWLWFCQGLDCFDPFLLPSWFPGITAQILRTEPRPGGSDTFLGRQKNRSSGAVQGFIGLHLNAAGPDLQCKLGCHPGISWRRCQASRLRSCWYSPRS